MKLKGELEEANMAPEGTLAAPRQKHNGNFGIWVWIGKRASEGERREAMRNAQGFIKAKQLKPDTPVTRVIDGGEPSEFKTLFKAWRDAEEITTFNR